MAGEHDGSRLLLDPARKHLLHARIQALFGFVEHEEPPRSSESRREEEAAALARTQRCRQRVLPLREPELLDEVGDELAHLRHPVRAGEEEEVDRKSTRLNSSHVAISYAVFCLKKKKQKRKQHV